MTYMFDTDVAALYGVDEAIMINNLAYWIRKNEANGKHYHEGRFWTYNSIEAFTKLFPFWTARQIRRVLKSLEDKGVIVTGNYNSSAYDRTTWYAFGDCILRNGQMDFTRTSNGTTGNENCIINNEANNNPVDKTNISADGGLFPSESGFENLIHTRRTSEQTSCLFSNSRFADYNLFAAEFNSKEYAGIDVSYYYHAVADWSAQKGKKMKDWIATARNFMRSDKENNKLHLIGGGVGLDLRAGLSADGLQYLKDMAD